MGDLGGGDHSITGNGGGGGRWERDPKEHYTYSVDELPDRTVENVTYTGGLDEIMAELEELDVGRYENAYHTKLVQDGGGHAPVCTAARVTRAPGGLCSVTATNVRIKCIFIGTVDFAEISKPIKSWRSDIEDETERPNLAAIESWELFKEHGDEESYASYKCDVTLADGTHAENLSDINENTLKLAKLMREKGVESYTIHTPVVTMQMVYTEFPPGVGSMLDMYYTGEIPQIDGYVSADAGFIESVSSLKNKWLCTADRCNHNADGTNTRVIQFTGADDINPDLYIDAGGGVE